MIFSADSSRLASASCDGTVRLWDTSDAGQGQCIGVQSRFGWICSIAISADGSRLASTDDATDVWFWDSSTGACIGVPMSHGAVGPMIFSPDGHRLASGFNDGSVGLWDGRTGAHIITLAGHSAVVSSAAFSPDGLWLAVGSSDHAVRLLDSRTGSHITTFKEHSRWAKSVTFSADGSRLISKSWDSNLLLWDITDIARPRVLCEKTAIDEFYLSTRNSLFLLETRTDPILYGLTVLNLGDGVSHFICLFPPDILPRRVVVNPEASFATIVCDDGSALFLDISKVPIS